jgi:hypothetical protein
MSKVILSHRVKDYDSWKVKYDADRPRRAAAGITEIAVGPRSDDPNMAYMIWDAKDPAVLDQMVSDPDLRKVMNDAGVISEPELVVIR